MFAGPAMLEAVDAAIKSSPWWLPGSPVLHIEGRRELFGQYGTRWKDDVDPNGDIPPLAKPVTHPGQVFAFTRHQCKAMRRAIRAEAKRLTSVC